MQRATIEDMLIKQASSQSILPFLSVHKGSKAPRRPVAHKRLSFVRSQYGHLRQMVIKVLGTPQRSQYALTWTKYFIGTCVRVNESVFAFLRRLNLIYFRWYEAIAFFLRWGKVMAF